MGAVYLRLRQDENKGDCANNQHYADHIGPLPDVVIHIHQDHQEQKSGPRVQQLAQKEIRRHAVLRGGEHRGSAVDHYEAEDRKKARGDE